MDKSKRLTTLIIIFFATLVFAVLLDDMFAKDIITSLVLIIIIAAILVNSLNYLENRNLRDKSIIKILLNNLLQSKENHIITDNDNSSKENILSKIQESKIADVLQIEDGKYIEILTHIQNLKDRIDIQVSSLSRNGNLNLLIGLTATMIATILLVIFVFIETKPTDLKMLAFHYGTRFSIVIFVEIFALFFLRLYKTNLFEIKYFQNELTNIDCKIIALKTAIYLDDKTAIRAILKELSNTERNHLLKKGETTVELERVKMEKDESKQLLENLTKLLQEKKTK